MREEAVVFGDKASLVGIVTAPPAGDPRVGVLLLSPGLLHRVGPNRTYVEIARRLAACGAASLRFDFSGVGDSSSRRDTLPVERSGVAETREAMDLLTRTRGVERFLVIGLCGGGYFAFRTACQDERVAGAVLMNVRGHLHGTDPALNDALRERAIRRHFLRLATRSSFRAKSIKKALSGNVSYGEVFRAGLSAVTGLFRDRSSDAGKQPVGSEDATLGEDLAKLQDRGAKLLHVYSEGDEGLDYLRVALGPDFRKKLEHGDSRFELLAACDHMFTLRWSQQHVLDVIEDWATASGGLLAAE
jgi:pimeloyl-ACP methyl ester carboxylesterase